MNSKRFVNLIAVMCILFVAAVGGGGCGGGGGGSSSSNYLTVRFNSNGGTPVDPIRVGYGEPVEAPADPTRVGCTFFGWYDNDEHIFEFGLPISEDIELKAEWAENFEPKTAEEIRAMAKIYDALTDVKYGGTVSVEFEDDGKSPIVSLDVSYTLDNAGAFDIQVIESGPLTKISGLVGNPVDVFVVGDGKVTSAEITFGLRSKGASSGLGIVYYDENNDIVVPLSSGVVGNTVNVSTGHFGQYAVVELTTFTNAGY